MDLPLEIWYFVAQLGGAVVRYKMACLCVTLKDLVAPLRRTRVIRAVGPIKGHDNDRDRQFVSLPPDRYEEIAKYLAFRYPKVPSLFRYVDFVFTPHCSGNDSHTSKNKEYRRDLNCGHIFPYMIVRIRDQPYHIDLIKPYQPFYMSDYFLIKTTYRDGIGESCDYYGLVFHVDQSERYVDDQYVNVNMYAEMLNELEEYSDSEIFWLPERRELHCLRPFS